MEEAFPVEVKVLDEEGRVDVTWSDGHVSPFPLRYLRGWCPCAICQGHFQGEFRFIENEGPSLLGAEPVGNYAMRLIFADGHDTGIYQFSYLRAICPSPELDPEQVRLKDTLRNRHEWGF